MESFTHLLPKLTRPLRFCVFNGTQQVERRVQITGGPAPRELEDIFLPQKGLSFEWDVDPRELGETLRASPL